MGLLMSARCFTAFLDHPLQSRVHPHSLFCKVRWLTTDPRPALGRSSSTFLLSLPDDPLERAFYSFSVLAKKDKSWQRFRHMIDLAVDYQSTNVRSVTDVGTDHGLLAVGLALSGKFETVLGVDISPKALKQGGLQVFEKVQDVLIRERSLRSCSNTSLLPLDFRLSDGLKQVQPGEADVVCIAGMGVNVMGKILQASSDNNILDLDRLSCQHLVLQPTNSRPRNLIQLYDLLQQSGWKLQDERIEYISMRWYLSTCFVRTLSPSAQIPPNLPTSKLARLDENEEMKMITRNYWDHHLKWIQRDEDASGGKVNEDEKRWRDWVSHLQSTQVLDKTKKT